MSCKKEVLYVVYVTVSRAIQEAVLLLEPKKICYVDKSLYFREQV